jgi:hypothetical protein
MSRKLHSDFKAAKEHLRAQMPIYLGKDFKNTFTSPFLLAQHIFTKSPRTYFVKNERGQSRGGAHRTITDVYKLVYYYFPKVKLITIYRAAFDLLEKRLVTSNICSSICRRIWVTNPAGYGGTFTGIGSDELCINYSKIKEFNPRNHNSKHDDSSLSSPRIKGIDYTK